MKKLMMAVGLAFGLSGAAWAAWPEFKELDGNGDGKISRDEANAVTGMNFAKADTNGDGWIAPSEYASGRAGPAPDVEPDGTIGKPRGMTGKPNGLPGNLTP